MPSTSSPDPDPALDDATDARSAARHPLSVSYLVIGLVFLGIAAMWALHAGGVIDSGQLGLLLPLTFVAAGAVGLMGFTAKGVSRSRRSRRPIPAQPADAWDPWEAEDRDADAR